MTQTDKLKILCIHHGACPDGVAAAWAFSKHYEKWEKHGIGEVSYYPAVHNKPPPWKLIEKQDVVWILDFAYSREDMLKMKDMLHDLKVLDHHKSAEKACAGLDFCKFDMSRSGAGMTWDHMFGSASRPWFIDCIEDRDIWKWEIEDSRHALYYLDTLPMTFETYDRLDAGEITMDEAIDKGKAIAGYVKRYNEETVGSAARKISFRDPSGEIHCDVPFINASFKGISEVLHEMSKGAKFSMGYYRRNDGKYKYSLRVSAESDFDVSELASRYEGGGGHAKAAGFTLDHELEEL